MIKLGSHVSMSGKDMFLGSVKEAQSYGANTFMVYTGAPQNTKRKKINELNLEAGWAEMKKAQITDFVVHAPYIINLANTTKSETFQLAIDFLQLEIERTISMGSKLLILHPGAHVGAGIKAGTAQIINGLNQVLTANTDCLIALETMAGKGTEIGRNFEELAAIYDGVIHNNKLRICFDTCHTHDSGYPISNDFDGVISTFDRILPKDQIAVFHINDSKNIQGASKDRHANLSQGNIGFEALYNIVHHKDFLDIPKILETPYIEDPCNPNKSIAPYKEEIKRLLAI